MGVIVAAGPCRTPAPRRLGPSPWDGFETGGDPARGPVAVGGDLEPATLVGAYRVGLFPWPTSDPAVARWLDDCYGESVRQGEIPSVGPSRPRTLDLPWWSPDPRGVIPVSGAHVSRSLKRHLRTCGWTTTLNRRFAEVMDRCVRGESERWITQPYMEAFTRLNALGYAHSIEVWDGETLIGGMFGVLTGGIYTGESMFTARTSASKVALIDMVARLREGGGRLLDVQTLSDHLRAMGAIEMPREVFLTILNDVRDDAVRLMSDRLTVSRLASRWNG